jgi:glycosyltransferase involved in cell wall biosynthesis
MQKKISIIIPVYNTKDYVQEAVDSILKQKEFIYEIILIDDGSTDGSGELLDKLYSGNKLIKIVHTKNQRQGPARNLGTQISSGEYIYYFDSDDVLRPELFMDFIEHISKDPDIELFCFSAEPFWDKTYKINLDNQTNSLSDEYFTRKINTNCHSGEEAYNLLYPIKSFSPIPFLYIFKKSILINNNISFRSIRYEDEEFTYQLFLHAGKTIIRDKKYCNRRIRPGSTMELDRCFVDILGYINTIETLQNLKKAKKLKSETIQNIETKIINLYKNIIIIKAASSLKLTKEEKKIYKSSLKPVIKFGGELFIFSYTYPIEYKLRKMKKSIFNQLQINFN